jgi:hypothetical protein
VQSPSVAHVVSGRPEALSGKGFSSDDQHAWQGVPRGADQSSEWTGCIPQHWTPHITQHDCELEWSEESIPGAEVDTTIRRTIDRVTAIERERRPDRTASKWQGESEPKCPRVRILTETIPLVAYCKPSGVEPHAPLGETKVTINGPLQNELGQYRRFD